MDSDIQQARVLFYCLGGGMGHLTRAAAISRKLKRFVKGTIAILTNSPFHYLLEIEDVHFIYLRNLVEIDDHAGNLIRGLIGEVDPELLVVDSYPAGIRGELVPLLEGGAFRKILLRRYIPHDLIDPVKFCEYTRSYYDLVIDCEALPPLDHPMELVACPLLIRDADELFSRETARDILLAKGDEKVVLGVATGKKEEAQRFMKLVEKAFMQIHNDAYVLRFASPYNFTDFHEIWHNIKYFPLFELFRGVDVLVGYAGYNLHYESRALSIPTIFIGHQGEREGFQPGSIYSQAEATVEDIEKKLREKMASGGGTAESPAEFECATSKAAAYLTNLLFSGENFEVKEYKDRIDWFLM
ncbi:MAG: hypothetical protein RDV48_16310 [Candidatus Eremiobacteraeota bacterium]|nr:hypothetical protein [Candidatus Eremiobacteraeota bacterium]